MKRSKQMEILNINCKSDLELAFTPINKICNVYLTETCVKIFVRDGLIYLERYESHEEAKERYHQIKAMVLVAK